MMQNAATAEQTPRLYIPEMNTESDDAILSLKPTAAILLRMQAPRSQLHAHTSSLRRAKRALEVVDTSKTCSSISPLLKIAVATISSEIAAAKMAMLASEEALREAHTYTSILQIDTPLHRAANLVINDFEAERAEARTLAQEVRALCQVFQSLVK